MHIIRKTHLSVSDLYVPMSVKVTDYYRNETEGI